jgi:hypothetical protein
MTIKSLQSTSLTNNIFYRSMLAGNDAFFPEFESDEFLEEVVLTSSASSVTFSSLGTYATAGYKHLQIRAVFKTTRASSTSSFNVFLNSDTTFANYKGHGLYGNGSAVVSDAGLAIPYPSQQVGAMVLDLLDFSSSTKNSTMRMLTGQGGGELNRIDLRSVLYNNTAAVTAIALSDSNYEFASGSRLSLYGSKG